jgi:hypothetical protein
VWPVGTGDLVARITILINALSQQLLGLPGLFELNQQRSCHLLWPPHWLWLALLHTSTSAQTQWRMQRVRGTALLWALQDLNSRAGLYAVACCKSVSA